MILYILLYLPFTLNCISCGKRRCQSNQIKTDEDFIIDQRSKGYSCWYKYHVWNKGQLKFAIFNDDYGEFQTVINFAFTVTINNQMAIHQFEYKNSTIWDKQLIAPLKDDQDAWHYLNLYFKDNLMQIQIYFNNEIYTGTNDEFFYIQINIADIPYQPHVLVIVCQAYNIRPDLQFLQTCTDDLEQNHTLNYLPDILTYYTNEFNIKNALMHVWLKDQQLTSQFSFNLTQQTIYGEHELMLVIKKQKQNIELCFSNWNDTKDNFRVNQYFNITSQSELQQWYHLYVDHNQDIYILTINKQYSTSANIQRSYPNAQIFFSIYQTSFAEFTISNIQQFKCPPSCEQCDRMVCSKCKGNRLEPDCSCPMYQFDYGQLNCEFPFKIRLFDIYGYNQPCPIGYILCSDRILCENGYIRYQNKCYKCPNLGNEICQQCMVQEETTEILSCLYTYQENLIRYKTNSLNDYMSFFQQRSYYDEIGQYFTLDLASVNVMYQFVNGTMLPIQKVKNSEYLCPYNFQAKLQTYVLCIKVPKACKKSNLLSLKSKCQICNKGYSMIQDECMKCPQYCQSCNQFKCTSCIDEYYLSLDGSCRKCLITHCKFCYEYNNGYLSLNDYFQYSKQIQYCALCEDNYEFNYESLKCQPKSRDCPISIFKQDSICLVDQSENQNKLSQKCQQLNCVLCYKTQCLKCQKGYYLDNQLCKQCKFEYIQKPGIVSRSSNSDLFCELQDLINYQHIQYDLQHILLLHTQELFKQIPLTMQIISCLNNEILYDSLICQPKNNEFVNQNQIDYCHKFIYSSNNQPYCIEIASGLNNMVIERETGLVKYCNGYQYCNIQVTYFLESIQNHYVYNNSTYEILTRFIDAIDYQFLLKNNVEQINIYLSGRNSDLFYQGKTVKQIPINLIIQVDTTPNPILYRLEKIHLLKLNNIIIDNFIGFSANKIQCRNLTIIKYLQKSRNLTFQELQMIINHKIESEILIVQQMNITEGNIIKAPLFELSKQSIVKIDNIEINNDCQEAFYFKFTNNSNTTVYISQIIIKDSNFDNCTLIDLTSSHIFHIHNLTIINSIIQESLVINSNNLNISTISIYNSTFFNSTLILNSNKLFIGQTLLLVKSNLYLSTIFLAKVPLTDLYVNQMQILKLFSVDSQLFDIYGSDNITITSLDLKDSNALSMKVQKSLIHLISKVVMIGELRNFYYIGNTSLLSIRAQAIYLARIQFKDNPDQYQFGYIDELCQFSIQQREYYKLMIIEDFSILMIKDSIFKNIYSTEYMFDIQSTNDSLVHLQNITFQRIQIFSNNLIEIKSDEITIKQMIFIDVWFHDIVQSKLQIYYLLSLTSLRIEVTNIYFINIKNINMKKFKWFIAQTDLISLENIIFNQQGQKVVDLMNQTLTIAQVDYLEHASGNYQLLFINCNSLFINKLSIRNVPSNSQYMIQITSNHQINTLKISQIVIESKDSINFFGGLVLVTSVINHAFISDIHIIRIQLQKYLFDLRVYHLELNNLKIRIIQGGILNCELLGFDSKAYIHNASIYKNKNTQFFIKSQVLFFIRNGQILQQFIRQIDFQNLTVLRVNADIINIENAVSVQLFNVLLVQGQFFSDLILVKSSICQNLVLSNIEIKKYFALKEKQEITFVDQMIEYDKRICWSGTFTKLINQMTKTNDTPNTLIKLLVDQSSLKHILFQSIVLKSNKDLQSLIISSMNFITNLTVINNTCLHSCIRCFQEDLIQRQLAQVEFNLELRDSQILYNTGILFDMQLGFLKLFHTVLHHNNKISQFIKYLYLNDSQILYQSQLSVDQIQSFNDSSILNQESVHLQISHKPQLLLSFDNETTYYPTINNSVRFYDKKLRQFNYCNFPTGQNIGEYQRLSLKNIKYTQFIKDMKFALRPQSETSLCKLKYLNISMDFTLNTQNWKSLQIIGSPILKEFIRFEAQCNQAILSFFVQILKCQLGEIFINNTCNRCDYIKNQYSVIPDAVHCLIINEQMNATLSGLISLKSGFWRPYFTNNIIAECPQLSNCQGGWGVGDQTCQIGYIGAACQECDLYSSRGQGKFIKNNNQCLLCQNSNYSYISLCSIVFLQLVLLHSHNISWTANCQRIRHLKLFKSKHFINLYKYELGIFILTLLDQMAFIIEILTNFIQIFLIINQYGYIMPDILKSLLSSYSNPNININSSLQCYLSTALSLSNLMYSRTFIFVILLMLFMNLYFTILGTSMIFEKQRYHIYLVFLVVNYIIIHNYINLAEIIIDLMSWRLVSGIKWMNANLSVQYVSQTTKLSTIVLPQIIVIVIIIPLIYYKILQKESNNLQYFIRWGYFYQKYKDQSKYWFLIIIYFKIAIVTANYISNLWILILVLMVQYSLILKIKPYVLKRFNQLNSQSTNILIILTILYSFLNYNITNKIMIQISIGSILCYETYLIYQHCYQVFYLQIIQICPRILKYIKIRKVQNYIEGLLNDHYDKKQRARNIVYRMRIISSSLISKKSKVSHDSHIDILQTSLNLNREITQLINRTNQENYPIWNRLTE